VKRALLLFSIIISTLTFAQEKVPGYQENSELKDDSPSSSVLKFKNNNLNDFKVFPNPTRNGLTVDIGELNGGISFQINDLMGKLVYSRKIVSYDLQNKGFKLDMSSFQNGVYMFSLKTKTASKIIKVVKL